MNRRYCLALDLKNDLEAIKQYEWHHSPEGVWPEVLDSIKGSRNNNLPIYSRYFARWRRCQASP